MTEAPVGVPSEETTALIERLFEAMNARDVEGLAEIEFFSIYVIRRAGS